MKKAICILLIGMVLAGCAYADDCPHTGGTYAPHAGAQDMHHVYCKDCDSFMRNETCSYGYAYDQSTALNGHIPTCTLCGRQKSLRDHEFITNKSGLLECLLCGYTTDHCAHTKTYQEISSDGTVQTICRSCQRVLWIATPRVVKPGDTAELGGNGKIELLSDGGAIALNSASFNKPSVSFSGGDFALTVSDPARFALSMDLKEANVSLKAAYGVKKVYDRVAADQASELSLSGAITIKDMRAFYGAIHVEENADVTVRGSLPADVIDVASGGALHLDDGITMGAEPSGEGDVTVGGKKVEKPSSLDSANQGGLNGNTLVLSHSSDYTVNGDENRSAETPVLLRYEIFEAVSVSHVFAALGIPDDDIIYSSDMMTVFVGGKTIQIKENSNIILVNGMPVTAKAPVFKENGRLYCEYSSLFNILRIPTHYDQDTGTLTVNPVQ